MLIKKRPLLKRSLITFHSVIFHSLSLSLSLFLSLSFSLSVFLSLSLSIYLSFFFASFHYVFVCLLLYTSLILSTHSFHTTFFPFVAEPSSKRFLLLCLRLFFYLSTFVDQSICLLFCFNILTYPFPLCVLSECPGFVL